MRTRTIARWRRAALGGALAVTLAVPARAEQDQPPPPVPPQATQPQDVQAPAQVQGEEPEAGIDATALNAPDEPMGASPDTSVSLPATPDLDVVGRDSRESRAALNTVSVSGKIAFSPPAVLSVRSSG